MPFVTSRWSSDRNAVVWQTSPDLETQSEMVWLISYRFRTLQQANVFTPFLKVFNFVFAEASWWRRLGIVSCFPRYSMFSTLIWHPLLTQTIIRVIIAATLSSLCVKCKHYKFQVWSDCEKINSSAVEIFEIDKSTCDADALLVHLLRSVGLKDAVMDEDCYEITSRRNIVCW